MDIVFHIFLESSMYYMRQKGYNYLQEWFRYLKNTRIKGYNLLYILDISFLYSLNILYFLVSFLSMNIIFCLHIFHLYLFFILIFIYIFYDCIIILSFQSYNIYHSLPLSIHPCILGPQQITENTRRMALVISALGFQSFLSFFTFHM